MTSILLVSDLSFGSFFSFLPEIHPCDPEEIKYSEISKYKKILLNEKSIVILDGRSRSKFKDFLASDLRIECNALFIACDEYDSSENLEDLFRDMGVKGLIDLSRKSHFSIPLFRLAFDHRRESIDLDDLNLIYKNLKEIGENTNSELKRIKRIHEKLVPLRRNRLNGIDVIAKYSAGEKIGGEFFDFIEVKGQLLLVLASTNSYISSNIVMEKFDSLRSLPEFTPEDIDNFVSDFYKAIASKEIPEVNKKVELLIGVVDTRSLDFWGINVGSTSVVSTKRSMNLANEHSTNSYNLEDVRFSLKLDRGEGCVVFSAGAKRNCKELLDGKPWQREVKGYLAKGGQETLSEIFYRLKRDRESSFLEEDATAIIFEVNKHAIIQV